MISYVRGELISVDAESIVVEAGQIGYNIRVPQSLVGQLPPLGEEVRIYTHFQVREDAMQLFGFLTRDDREIFRMLLGVSGIGPKVALGILSVMTTDDLRFAVLSGDAKAIARAPGLGPKTAQKVILELKDKLNLEDAFEKRLEHGAQGVSSGAAASDAKGEAVEALTALGYSATEALRAVRGVEGADGMDVEELLKQALKGLSLF
ncbi:MAG: Holliday junction branch migration protein RuvA [Lachnospiraceae bacterium]|nr:Holliday junction branch migration protein RuvA [Lachnospiraceae bacterium]